MNLVNKDATAETYRIRVNHEWATIVLFGWSGEDDPGKSMRHCGEILIHSSYGQWAHIWIHMGQPFKTLLQKIERGYTAGKMMGSDAYKFDGALTVRELRIRLLNWRQCGDLGKDDARALWDYILERQLELESSAHEFVEAMHQAGSELVPNRQVLRFIQEPWEQLSTSIDQQFEGFWAEIWPAFISELKREELEQANA